MKVKRFFRTLCIILACMFVLSVLALSSGCESDDNPADGGTSDKPTLPTSEYSDDDGDNNQTAEEDNTPVDEGEIKDNIFEAESARFYGVSTKSNASLGDICVAQSFFFDLSFSGSTIVRNITQTTNRYAFEFTSDKAYQCSMEVAVASAYSSTWVERALYAMYDIIVNDDMIDSDVMVPAGTEDQVKGGNNYTCIQHVEVPITIKEGSNTIVMKVLSGVCNLDYINIKTSANITDYVEYRWDDDTVVTIDLPTKDAAGTINLACETHSISNTFALPIPAEESGYAVNGDLTEHSFMFNCETYTIKTDGTYSFPDHVKVVSTDNEDPEEDTNEEQEDPNADSLPEVIVKDKNFFDPANWTTFTSGTSGAQPTAINSALKFTNAARFDLFYVTGNSSTVHIADKASTLDGQDVYNKDYSWTFDMSATGTYDMLLFATASLPSSYGQSGAAGVYLTFEENKVSVRNAYYGSETTSVIAEATTSLTLDGTTRYKVKVTANRVDGETFTFKISIGDTILEFVAVTASTAGATVSENTVSLHIGSSGSYGQRVAIVPGNSIVRIYGLAIA